jgi:hypothetical protein
MSQQEPAFYNLEFYGDALFWEGAGNDTRRAFLMPLSNPAEFVAFGVFGPSKTVHFVARGRVQDHLGSFLASMQQAEAGVELYERVPLPWPLVKRYTSDDPFEGTETDPPKGTTNGGRIYYAGGAGKDQLNTYLEITATPTWPSGTNLTTDTRKVFIMPLPGQGEFLALGVCSAPEQNVDRFVFMAQAGVGEHLDGFIARMKQASASVVLCDWPPLSYLQKYVATAFQEAYQLRSIPPSDGVTSTLKAA